MTQEVTPDVPPRRPPRGSSEREPAPDRRLWRSLIGEFAATYLAVVLGGLTALPIAHFIIDTLSPMVSVQSPWWVPLPSARAQQLGIGKEWKTYADVVRDAEKNLADHIRGTRGRIEGNAEGRTAENQHAVRTFSSAVRQGRAQFFGACCDSLHQQSEIQRVWSQMAAEVVPRFPEGGDYRLVDEQGGETGLVIGVADGRVCVRCSEGPDARGPCQEVWQDLTTSKGFDGPYLGATGLRRAGHVGRIDLAVDIRTQRCRLVIAVEGAEEFAYRGTLRFLASP